MPEAVNTISANLDKLKGTTVRKERANSFTHRTELSVISPRLTQSQVYSKYPRVQRPKSIPENELASFQVEEEVRLDSRKTSIQSNKSNKSKRSNRSSRSARGHTIAGFHHEDGDNLPNSTRSSEINFDRTSSRNTSINSRLTVTREQYWCFSKWTPCEKKLGVSVVVLISLIVILGIIIGVLANQDDSSGVEK